MVKESAKIEYLLKLIDDESPVVRTAVAKELVAYGPGLAADLKKMKISDEQMSLVKERYAEYQIGWLESVWDSWRTENNEDVKLEKAISLLADFQNGPYPKTSLGPLLDQIASEFKSSYPGGDEFELAEFLFKQKGLKGVKRNYYDPRHSNLVYVIEKQRGIPISLGLIYMFVGKRLGFRIEGCNFPGHFLARVSCRGGVNWVDCFSQGRFYTEKEMLKIQEEIPESATDTLHMKIDAETIVSRCLVNLLESYRRLEWAEHCDLMTKLIARIKQEPKTAGRS